MKFNNYNFENNKFFYLNKIWDFGKKSFMKINDKTVLVSGAGKGIGKEIFMKCLNNAKFTYGIVRNKRDYLSLSKLKNKKNLRYF